ncbi:adenylate/guanylate cyclase domain-containing protein [Nocardia sp. NPDC051570]|uniref:adenylate/guanylate cyclase domain-containing protein n=1 Tax=Nocardia sp. NPDC051570 TaxID=3364324 RepID=UPI0037983CF6
MSDGQTGGFSGQRPPFDDSVWDAVTSAFADRRGLRVAITANGIGFVLIAVQVCALSMPWAGGKSDFEHDVVFLCTIAAAYFVVAVTIAVYRGERRAARAFGWVHRRREPTARERALTLNFARVEALDEVVGWLIGALLFGALFTVRGYPVLYGVRVGIVVALGGLTVGAVSFLLLEMVARPVLQVVLSGEVAPAGAVLGLRRRLLLGWTLGAGIPLVMLGTAAIGDENTGRTGLPVSLGLIAAVGILVGLAVTFAMARSLIEPLTDLQAAQRRVQAGDLAVQVAVDDSGELGHLQAGFNHMVAGLRERKRLHDLFDRHVGTQVARFALAEGARVGGERRQASVLFVDVIGSTAMAQRLAPEAVVTVLNDVFAAVVRCVGAEGGWVNKFEGDAALCVFGPPAEHTGHAAAVLRAARALRFKLVALAERHPGLDTAIGVSSGMVVAGNIGAEDRYEYTVIGDAVNEAARLTEQAKTVPERVLAGENTIADAADESSWWRPYEAMKLRGRSTPTETFVPIPVQELSSREPGTRTTRFNGALPRIGSSDQGSNPMR